MNDRPEYLDSLEKDLKLYKEAIRETSESIREDEISAYPVFIIYRDEFPVGEAILDKSELDTEWSVNASTAEELIKKGIIPLEKAKFFVENYRPAADFICLFVVTEEAKANFIFVPY